MNDKVKEGLARLRDRLPLEARQRALPPAIRELHRLILRSLGEQGSAPSRERMAAIAGEVEPALAELQRQDLVVLNRDGAVIGAYPMTLEDTPHRVLVNGRGVNAMCSIDALGISPMLKNDTRIESKCRITGTPIWLHQSGMTIVAAEPHREILAGIRWQKPTQCAAHSLCREMVFLIDADAARTWQGDEPELHQVFTLDEAIGVGASFFVPLLA